MRRRIEVRETVIAPGTVVRLSKAATSRLSMLMARWEVLSIAGDNVLVEDIEDQEDTRTFKLEDLERVKGGESKVVGYDWVEELYGDPADAEGSDDPYDDADVEIEYPSLFDDPIVLSEEDDE